MPSKSLEQVVAYIAPDLKRQLEHEIKKSSRRTSVSSFIEGALRQYLNEARRKGAA